MEEKKIILFHAILLTNLKMASFLITGLLTLLTILYVPFGRRRVDTTSWEDLMWKRENKKATFGMISKSEDEDIIVP